MRILHIAKNDLRIKLRDRGAIVSLILIPLVLIIVASAALSGAFGGSAPLTVPIADEDGSPASRRIVESLSRSGNVRVESIAGSATLRERVAKAELGGGFVIPKGFGAALAEGRGAEILVLKSAASQVQARVVDGAARTVADGINSRGVFERALLLSAPSLGPEVRDALIQRATTESAASPAVSVKAEVLGTKGAASIRPFEQNVPGYGVMFLLFGATNAAGALLSEREDGTFRRLLSSPLGKTELLLGKMTSAFLTGLFQLVLFFAIGRIFFGLSLGHDPFALVVLILVTDAAAVSLGLVMAALAGTRAQLQGVSTLIVLSMSAIGGSWWPLEIVPRFLRELAKLTITGWAMDGFHQLLSYGGGLTQILPSLAALLVMATIFFGVGASRFRFE